MSISLSKEFDYYKKNQEDFVAKYNGKFLVIKNMEVVGVYDAEMDAYTDAKNKYELGTFLIQECIHGNEGYTQVFHSRVTV